MKDTIREMVRDAVRRAHRSGRLPSPDVPEIEVEEPKLEAHGDFSSNVAMVSARVQKMAPRRIAEAILEHLDDSKGIVERSEIAGPGFLNFFLRPAAWVPVLKTILEENERFGVGNSGKGQRVQVEFVSSNPTGPLHVGHGRGAAVGDSTANLLVMCGYDVQKEYYINDSGRQIRTLGLSVFLRYRQRLGESVVFPEECYQGDYIRELAEGIFAEKGSALLDWEEEKAVLHCARIAAAAIIDGIRDDLHQFGVTFDRWFSEQSLYDDGSVDDTVQQLKRHALVYEKDGAVWFRTSGFGDEKDRVVIRSNGQTTYFASDIAYHRNKFERGLERVIDVWGADHHGYIPRMRAALEASGYRKEQFDVILVQLVNLLRGGEPVAMSTRAGEFVTLRDVIDEVGSDAARFIFLTRHHESPLDFDLELAKKKTNENPVYYVQYVHARICSIEAKAQEKGFGRVDVDEDAMARLKEAEETRLIQTLARYPEVVAAAADFMEPHRVAFYLMELASAFHAYYNKHRVLVEDRQLMRGRLCLVLAVRNVIRNGLKALGVSAPTTM